MRTRRAATALLAATLLLAACDSGEDPEDSEQTREATAPETEESESTDPADLTRDGLIEALTALQVDQEPAVPEQQAACLSTAWIDAVGADSIIELGVDANELYVAYSMEELGLGVENPDAFVAELAECELADVVAGGIVAAATEEVELDCVRGHLDDEIAAELSAFIISEAVTLSDAAESARAAIQQEC